MKLWIPLTLAVAIVAVVVVVTVVIHPSQPAASVETPAEQAQHAAERDKVTKDFYNPPKPGTRPTGLYNFKGQETQPAKQ